MSIIVCLMKIGYTKRQNTNFLGATTRTKTRTKTWLLFVLNKHIGYKNMVDGSSMNRFPLAIDDSK